MFILVQARQWKRMIAAALCVALLTAVGGVLCQRTAAADAQKADFIKWVDFDVTYEAMDKALKLDIASHETPGEIPLNWVELLAYLAAKNGGDFSRYRAGQMDALVEELRGGKTMEQLTENMKYYGYYKEAYGAALGGFVGEYEIQVADDTAPDGKKWVRKYGLKAFLPIAKNYPYTDYDDFGTSRSYGFKRTHLGHDFMGATGTPIIAVEGGTVEALGWNQYGGWRIGIRSLDKKRYYYYAHLRQNFPFNKSLKVGSVVQPGDVIGYLGHTGYSTQENVNNIKEPHLHFGMQLIFDESQKESDNEIWIDVYAITRLLYRNRCEVVKDPETKEYSRVYAYREVEPGT